MPEGRILVDSQVALGNLPVGTRFAAMSYIAGTLQRNPNLSNASYSFYEVGERHGGRVYLDRYMAYGTPDPTSDSTFAYSLSDFGSEYRFTILRYGLDGEEYYAHS